MKKYCLKADQRALLELVEQAVVANPFSDERLAIDERISGTEARLSPDETLDRALGRIGGLLGQLDEQGHRTLESFRDSDKRLMSTAYLFDVFHRSIPGFDALIRRQMQTPKPCPATFVSAALGELKQRGFSTEDARRYVAVFYQLRRAFYFIHYALVGRSACLKTLRLSLWNNVFTRDLRLYEQHLWNRMEDFSTLLLGETGSGKGAAAVAIGRSGFIPYSEERQCFQENFMETFIAINLSQFPESLIESELFGHRKGAFTGAVESHEGVFARCSPHGAIFIDEIGDVSIPVQIKLLKVLQDREFSPVGSHEKRRFSGRVIAASNKSIDALRGMGLFRDDFFYRLCSDVITVPPLRQRLAEEPGELDDLLAVMIERIVGHPDETLLATVRETIAREPGPGYAWPGNVRELEQCVRRILLTRSYGGDVRTAPDPQGGFLRRIEEGALSAQELLASYCALLHRRHGTYEEVARRTGLDRRTVKKYVEQAGEKRRGAVAG